MTVIGDNIYVADDLNHRIQRITQSGGDPQVATATGWIGRIQTTAGLGGDAGCSAAAVASFTPGWCTGGTSNNIGTTFGDGNFNSPYRVTGDATNLYVADFANHRIQKFVTSTGAFVGWAGRINTQPTGGDAGCAVAAVTTATPGWCTGGNATFGFGQEMRYSPQGLELRGGYLFVSDTLNYRISQVDPATAAVVGQLGAKVVPTTVWNTSNPVAHFGAYDDKSFFLPVGITVAGSSIYVGDSTNHRVKKMSVNSGVFEGWIGNVATTPTGGDAGCTTKINGQYSNGWCTGGNVRNGTGDGMLNTPQGVLEKDGNLYVADQTNHRISRYTLTSGAFTGWVGRVNTTPTGGAAGCTATASNSPTPGWCLGGTSKSGTTGVSATGALNSPNLLAADATYLFVSSRSNSRIDRYIIATGAYAGWIGRVNATPTSGDAGCTSAALDSFTPGWCIGGTSKTGTGDGHFNAMRGISLVGSSLYVSDTSNNRIQRFTVATGAFTGWIGRVSVTPTGGDTGCTIAAVDSATPGWCVGGVSKSGSISGGLNIPRGIWSNGTSLYVADTSNHRISKFNLATGVFEGWMGQISTSPTGGAVGCAGAAVNTLTPGWCTGGTSKTWYGDGMLDTPDGVTGSGLYIYVTDSSNSRVMRFPQ